jgi:SAM-dependent methyltransferase
MEEQKFTPPQAREFFNQQADLYSVIYRHHHRNYPWVFRAAKIQPEETVLELGCGAGWFSLKAARTVRCVVGIDIAERLIEKARDGINKLKLESNSIGFAVGDITNSSSVTQALATISPPVSNLPASGRFDVIVLSEVTQYIPEDLMGAFFEVVKGSLQRGGRIVMTWEGSVKAHHTVDIAVYCDRSVTGRLPVDLGVPCTGTYIGRMDECVLARNEAYQVARHHGLRVIRDRIVDWPRSGYSDGTLQVRMEAQVRARETSPTLEDLEAARRAWTAEMEVEFREDRAWRTAIEYARRAGDEIKLKLLIRVPAVIVVLQI